jgi:hydrogenase small subunit
VIHENCPRRAHFDAGRFAAAFGDEGHRKGWCLYKMGCKGPVTHAACSTRHFNEIPDCGRSELEFPAWAARKKNVVWKMGTFETVPIHLATPPDTYPPIYSGTGGIKVGAAALVGAVAGASAARPGSTRSASRAARRPAWNESKLIVPTRKNSKRHPESQSRRKRTDVASLGEN